MTFPVVGVCPWRTRNTTVGLGALLVRVRDLVALAAPPARVDRAVWVLGGGGTTPHRRLGGWFLSTRRRRDWPGSKARSRAVGVARASWPGGRRSALTDAVRSETRPTGRGPFRASAIPRPAS